MQNKEVPPIALIWARQIGKTEIQTYYLNKMKEENKTVTIPLSEYNELRKDSLKLNYLENGGVDNWEWYGASLEGFDEELEELLEESE